jgi:hypothetical protein
LRLMKPPSPGADVPGTDPIRLRNFALFFKNYMSVSALVTAALPIPITSLKLIPTFEAHRGIFSVYTTLFCFLTLGFIFYHRHALARSMFAVHIYRRELEMLESEGDFHANLRYFSRRQAISGFLPAVCIALSVACVFWYHHLIDAAMVPISKLLQTLPGVEPSANLGSSLGTNVLVATNLNLPMEFSSSIILSVKESYLIEGGSWIMLAYLGIFVFAEAAFILMAIREYMQELMRIPENDLIMPLTYSGSRQARPASFSQAAEDRTVDK